MNSGIITESLRKTVQSLCVRLHQRSVTNMAPPSFRAECVHPQAYEKQKSHRVYRSSQVCTCG